MLRSSSFAIVLFTGMATFTGCADDGGPARRGPGSDAGAAIDAGPPDGGPSAAACAPARVRSRCGHEASVVRVRAVLGEGMAPVTGNVYAALYHEALGGGAQGGVPHWVEPATGTVSPTEALEIHFDHCDGGEMWSEENCGYHLWVFVDRDEDLTLDPGEPTGRVFTELSCHAEGPLCETVVLDCLDGPGCVAFADPPYCPCTEASCEGAASPDRIITCLPPG